MNASSQKPLERWFLALSAWPALAAMAIAGEVIVFRLIVGRWPIPSLDDPKHQPFLVLHALAQILVMAIPAVVLVQGFFVFRQWRLFARERAYTLLLLLFIGGLAALVMLPEQWQDWFAD